MNHNSLIAVLNSKENLPWSLRNVNGENETVEWLEILIFKDSCGIEHSLGLTKLGDWRGQFSDKERVTSKDVFIPFLTTLEFTRVELQQKIRSSLSALELPDNIIKTYPFDQVLYLAFSQNWHWKSLAEKWLKNGYPLSPELIISFPEHPLIQKWKKKRLDKLLLGT